MRNFFYLLMALMLVQIGFAQSDLAQLLSGGSWELTEITGPESEYRTDTLLGNEWHFPSRERIVMKSTYGQWTMPVTMEAEILIFQGKEYPVKITGENSFELTDDTEEVLTTVRFERMTGAELPVLADQATARGDFRLDGFYYQEIEDHSLVYHYYRFYENGEVLEVSSSLTPPEMALFLNRAYFYDGRKVDWNVLRATEESAAALTFERVIHPNIAAQEQLTTTCTFLPDADGLAFKQVSIWANDTTRYEHSGRLEFHATDRLATWEGKELMTDSVGLADRVFLVQPFGEAKSFSAALSEMPRFPGCEEIEDGEERKACAQLNLLKFIYQNIKYPPIARENGVEGTVVVTFVVEKDGSISNIRVIRDIGANCGGEAMRTVELMQTQGLRWEPGKVYGKPVRVQFNLPVKFKLEGRTRKKRRRSRG